MFELDEEIEVSYYADFNCLHKGKFKHQDPDPTTVYWVVDKDGYMMSGSNARKIEKKVAVCINFKVYEVSVELADKIISGDV